MDDGVFELEPLDCRTRMSTMEASLAHRAYCVELQPCRQVMSALSPQIETPSSERLNNLPKVTYLVNGRTHQTLHWHSVNIHCALPIVSILLPQNSSEI